MSRGDNILFVDADLSVPIETADNALRLLESGWDAVIGSRRLPQSRILVQQPLWRRLGGAIFHTLRRLAVPSRIRDTQCGFKLFRGDLAREVFSGCRLDRALFDVEILHALERNGYRILEMPVDWSDVKGSKFKLPRDAWLVIRDLARIRGLLR